MFTPSPPPCHSPTLLTPTLCDVSMGFSSSSSTTCSPELVSTQQCSQVFDLSNLNSSLNQHHDTHTCDQPFLPSVSHDSTRVPCPSSHVSCTPTFTCSAAATHASISPPYTPSIVHNSTHDIHNNHISLTDSDMLDDIRPIKQRKLSSEDHTDDVLSAQQVECTRDHHHESQFNNDIKYLGSKRSRHSSVDMGVQSASELPPHPRQIVRIRHHSRTLVQPDNTNNHSCLDILKQQVNYVKEYQRINSPTVTSNAHQKSRASAKISTSSHISPPPFEPILPSFIVS